MYLLGEVRVRRLRGGHHDGQVVVEVGPCVLGDVPGLQDAPHVLPRVPPVPDTVQQSNNKVFVCLQGAVELQGFQQPWLTLRQSRLAFLV